MNTKTGILAMGLVALLLSAPAFAFHCPKDMKAIDAALEKNPQLSESQLATVKELRAEGERLHVAGNHQAAVDTLAKALDILNITPGY